MIIQDSSNGIQSEEAILDAVKEWVTYLPAYNHYKFFRVATRQSRNSRLKTFTISYRSTRK